MSSHEALSRAPRPLAAGTLVIVRLTIAEAHRRWVLWAVGLMGLAFLALFAVGFWLVDREVGRYSTARQMAEAADFFLLAGLYAVNFLAVVLAVLVSVDSISGEIASGTIHTVVTKPMRRWEVVLGKWLGLAAMLALFTAAMSGALMAIVWAISGYLPRSPVQGVLLIALGGIVLLTVSIAGGTRLSTLANGVLALMLYGLAFIAGWIEQFGAFLSNDAAVNVSIAISLVMPAEAMWRRAAHLMEPPLLRSIVANPFAGVSAPSPAMVAYTVLYVAVLLLVAMSLFARRDL